MTPRRVLVTGASGFVGQVLLARLAREFPEARIEPAAVDVTDAPAVAARIADALPDAVVHLAAVSAVGDARRDPDRAWQVNLGGTLTLARAVLAHAPGCVLLFTSSGEAYGASFRSGEPLTEAAPLAPQGTYGATKAAADLALGAMVADGLRVIRARPFNHTGPGQSDAFVVPAFAHQVARIAAGKQPPVLNVGNLQPRRDFLDVRDVCAAYAAMLRRADVIEPGTILNVAAGQTQRIGEVLDQLIALAGITATVQAQPSRQRASDIPVACGEATRARVALDWVPQHPWTETLASVLDYWVERVRDE